MLQPFWMMPVAEGAPVALTFDDGPNPPHTLDIIDVLTRRRVAATFFFVGECAAAHPDIVGKAVAARLGVGVHSWDHQDLRGKSRAFVDDQIGRTLTLLRDVGAEPHLFRAPYHHWDDNVLEAAFDAGLVTVAGDVDAGDWTYPGSDAIRARVREDIEPGSIVVLHDGGGDASQTVAALPEIIDDIAGAGLSVVDLADQLTV